MSLEEVRFLNDDDLDDYDLSTASSSSVVVMGSMGSICSIGPPTFPGGQFDTGFMKMKCSACHFWNIYKVDKTLVLECNKCGSPLEP